MRLCAFAVYYFKSAKNLSGANTNNLLRRRGGTLSCTLIKLGFSGAQSRKLKAKKLAGRFVRRAVPEIEASKALSYNKTPTFFNRKVAEAQRVVSINRGLYFFASLRLCGLLLQIGQKFLLPLRFVGSPRGPSRGRTL